MTLLTNFLEEAPPGTAMALEALACAESLTDSVACAIYEHAPVSQLTSEDFIEAFKYSGLTEPRNSEWNLLPALRQELVSSSELDIGRKQAVHRMLLCLAQDEGSRDEAGFKIPSYLFTKAGLAYHLAGAGNLEEALKQYSYASEGAFSGAQWLGAKLAEEQERTKTIPEDEVETTFLKAWVFLREGRKQEAMPLLRKVAATNREMREVAIALHVLGNDNSRSQRQDAEADLRRSIQIGERIGREHHTAQTLHSFANLLSRQSNRFEEAEQAYRRSIEMLEALGDELGVAQTLHSFANFLSRQSNRFEEAEQAYRRSIEMLEALGDELGVAQTLHSFANFLNEQGGRLFEAEEAYLQSIKIGEDLHHDRHLAQVLRSYAFAVEERSSDEAIRILEQSIELDQKLGSYHFVSRGERELSEMRERAAVRYNNDIYEDGPDF